MTNLLVTGIGLHQLNGLRGRFSSEALQLADRRTDRIPYRNQHHDLSLTRLRNFEKPLVSGANAQPTVIILGDSHGDALMPGIVRL